MRLNRNCFKVINPIMALILRSPLHFLFSDSILLLAFIGRKSRRRRTTPARYMNLCGVVRCFTSQRTRWWRNLLENPRVELRIAGSEIPCEAKVIYDNAEIIRPALEKYLRRFPQDAVYHYVNLNADGAPDDADLTRAAQMAVMIEAIPRAADPSISKAVRPLQPQRHSP